METLDFSFNKNAKHLLYEVRHRVWLLPFLCMTLLFASFQTEGLAQAESIIGNLSPLITGIHASKGFPMDFAHRGDKSVSEWQKSGREMVQSVLAYTPPAVSLDVTIHSVLKREGYEIRTISFAGSPYYRIPAYLLVPEGKGPFPGVVALHDHGGWYFHGKEKLVAMPHDNVAIKQFRDQYYGGRAYAEELAQRGFVVLVADALYWGERRLQYRTNPKALEDRLAGLDSSETGYVDQMNAYLAERVQDMKTRMSFAGTTWGGIINYDDRRAVDLLVAMPEVDADKIGCIGLSGGGFRSTYLSGMEPRIKAAVIVGWMVSMPSMIGMSRSVHTDMFHAYGLHAKLDHPDVAALGAPNCATFVVQCGRDHLFPRQGMDRAIAKIQAVYFDLNKPEQFKSQYYDVTHQFNIEMQEDAFDWLEKWLK